jgi:hypothetical protein
VTAWLAAHRGRLTAVASTGSSGPVALLGAHAQQHLDGVDRRGHAGHLDDGGAVGVEDLVAAAHPGVPVARGARHVPDLPDDAAQHQAEAEHADGPAE